MYTWLTCNFWFCYKGRSQKKIAKYEKHTPANEAIMSLANKIEKGGSKSKS